MPLTGRAGWAARPSGPRRRRVLPFKSRRGRPEARGDEAAVCSRLVVANARGMWAIFRALRRGWPVETIHGLTRIRPWFLQQFAEIVEL